MPRFIVTLCDTQDGQIESQLIRALTASGAIVKHRWITEVYREEYVNSEFYHEDLDNCCHNIYSLLSWAVSCVNLDDAIMRDLNGGDFSVSSNQPPA